MTITATETNNYTSATATVEITILKANQTLTFKQGDTALQENKVTVNQGNSATINVERAEGELSVSTTVKPENAGANGVNVSCDSSGKTVTVVVAADATVGTYTIEVKAEKTNNYNASQTATFTVEVK